MFQVIQGSKYHEAQLFYYGMANDHHTYIFLSIQRFLMVPLRILIQLKLPLQQSVLSSSPAFSSMILYFKPYVTFFLFVLCRLYLPEVLINTSTMFGTILVVLSILLTLSAGIMLEPEKPWTSDILDQSKYSDAIKALMSKYPNGNTPVFSFPPTKAPISDITSISFYATGPQDEAGYICSDA